MKLKTILISIHLWVGIFSGLIVVILGLTGCVLTFVDEIRPLVYADRLEVPSTQGTQISLQEMVQKAQYIWGKDKPVSALEIQNKSDKTFHFRSYQEDDNNGIWYWNEKKFYESLFMDPYTGKLVFYEHSEFEFFRVILYLHWSLLLKTDLGQPIVGTATLLYLILLITGVYLWWPKNKKARRVRFWFRWKADTGIIRKNYDLHNILGFYSLSIGIVIALTGLIFAFPWFNTGVQRLLNIRTQAEMPISLHSEREIPKDKPLDNILTDIKKKYPDATAYHFYFPRGSSSVVTILARYESIFKTTQAQYNIISGRLIQANTFDRKDSGEKFRDINYGIHTGSILGLPSKILVFLISLISASLPITGFLIWYNKKWGKRRMRT
ncbi:PepSY-associated TM helix domain-containing protein [Pedobacter antarcticus]|uniref:PepSY-associated TM helix domain-containing protein n=1 Tax=Pedobacter antarcticus TaxID=34086 RepID=UPI00292F9642|nr:PepSY-associated TM helix domain-containing protein [Pedobacter antarcticus]